MENRGFSNSLYVAELRYIQSIHETSELQNPDRLVGQFLPILRRWRCAWLSQSKIGILRTDPFYYYLVARTKYYDKLFLDAIADNVQYLINVGCGTDTRAYRFEQVLRQKGVKVLECDQPEAILAKQDMVKRVGTYGYVAYVSIDLNDDTWPDFEHWLGENNRTKALVLMEGVSPYVNSETFNQFLRLLRRNLPMGSRVAYDFKLRGIADGFGLLGRTKIPFRLGGGKEEVAIFHKDLGYQLAHMERSFDLSTRFLSSLEKSRLPLFIEDALVQLELIN
jgi:methyltransferase (TIGR00027 family)